jgi:uncharacterized protein (DUF1330 family)
VPVYLITQVVAEEPQRLRPYLEQVVPLIEEHGGEFVDLIRATEILEGSWPEGALSALVRFPDLESMQAFWSDPEYDPLRRLRHEVAVSTVVVATPVRDR